MTRWKKEWTWKGEGKDNDGNRHETRKNDEEKT
jgi:hypothetical protein